MILGALAEGTTTVTGLLEGADILHTAQAMRDFGAEIIKTGDGAWQIKGRGAAGLDSPDRDVDFGNAGTGARLIMGAASAYDIKVRFVGDESLSGRPMGRVLVPLSQMGATFDATRRESAKGEIETLPARLTRGGQLKPIDFTPPQASAQVKSCILLAGLQTDGQTTVRESITTRDHSENMLSAFGARLTRRKTGAGQTVTLHGPAQLQAAHVDVPGDPSSAAFPIVAALIIPGSDITVKNVMLNPTRAGLFNVLQDMGGHIEYLNQRTSGGETVADIHVKYSPLKGIEVPAETASTMIDEYPILAVAAACAAGTTKMPGLHELTVKESNRLTATTELLKTNGVAVQAGDDWMHVTGGAVKGGGTVITHHDHRIAMSALILGQVAKTPVVIDDMRMIATSFPTFFDLMTRLGARFEL